MADLIFVIVKRLRIKALNWRRKAIWNLLKLLYRFGFVFSFQISDLSFLYVTVLFFSMILNVVRFGVSISLVGFSALLSWLSVIFIVYGFQHSLALYCYNKINY